MIDKLQVVTKQIACFGIVSLLFVLLRMNAYLIRSDRSHNVKFVDRSFNELSFVAMQHTALCICRKSLLSYLLAITFAYSTVYLIRLAYHLWYSGEIPLFSQVVYSAGSSVNGSMTHSRVRYVNMHIAYTKCSAIFLHWITVFYHFREYRCKSYVFFLESLRRYFVLLEFYTYVIRSVLLNHMNESYRANDSAVPDFILSMRNIQMNSLNCMKWTVMRLSENENTTNQ